MKRISVGAIIEFGRCAILALAVAAHSGAYAQKQKPAAKEGETSDHRLIFAINEGAAGNMTATDILFRYEGFKPVVEKAIGQPIVLLAVRDAKELRRSISTGAYALIMSRPADTLAEAVKDYGYQAVVSSTE